MYAMKEHANPGFMFTGRIISYCSCLEKTFSKQGCVAFLTDIFPKWIVYYVSLKLMISWRVPCIMMNKRQQQFRGSWYYLFCRSFFCPIFCYFILFYFSIIFDWCKFKVSLV